MRKLIFFILIPGLLLSGCNNVVQDSSSRLSLLPYPQELLLGQGEFSPGHKLTIKASGINKVSDPVIFTQLEESFIEFGTSLEASAESDAGMPDMWLGLPESDDSFKIHCERTISWPVVQVLVRKDMY